jgi:ubiquinone/menaquinone biosynthesis C-methylase UbiE
MPATSNPHQRLRRYWDKHSRSYDRQMRFFDRRLFGESRAWVCAQATGEVLEVAIGTGLNLPLYPADVQLTGIEWSPAMLEIARRRAAELGRAADLVEGDAHALPYPDQSFDTVVCTLSLCAIPDPDRAVAEMARVLRPGRRLLLLDHVAGSAWPVRAVQRLLELVTVPLGGEHFLRRPLNQVHAAGLSVDQSERFKLGVVERIAARKPGHPGPSAGPPDAGPAGG